MSGIINLIKNLVGGIFGFLGGLFSKKEAALEGGSNQSTKKSSSGYFLELDDSKSAKSAAMTAAPASVTSTEAIADSGNGKAPKEPKKSTRKEKLAAAKASNGASAPNNTAKAASQPESAPASEVGFATKYPIQVSSGGRRLPGANMNSFLDMARQMK